MGDPPTGRARGRIAPRVQWVGWGAAVGISLVGNAVLFRALLASQRDNNAIRLDPSGQAVYASAAPPSTQRPVLLFFGDSRALMWAPPDSVGPYEVVNRGIGNQTTAQILLRIAADVTPLHPAVVVVEAGVNDLKTIPQFPMRRQEIVADCKRNLEQIVARCRASGATVVVTSVFSIGDLPLWHRPFWSDAVEDSVREVNGFLRTLARDGVVFFDADPVLNDPRGKVRPSYQYDYLHLAPAGYNALDQPLVALLHDLPR